MIHPQFCEIVTRASRSGTYLARYGAVHYSILWRDSLDPKWEPSVGIRATGKINHTLLESLAEKVGKNISSRTNIRRRGGLKKGKRVLPGGDKPVPEEPQSGPKK